MVGRPYVQPRPTGILIWRVLSAGYDAHPHVHADSCAPAIPVDALDAGTCLDRAQDEQQGEQQRATWPGR